MKGNRHALPSALISVFLALVVAASFSSAQNVASASAPAHQPVLDIDSIDSSVDPCTDFYTYACGGWIKKNPIPPDQSSWAVYSKLQDDNRALLRKILEDAAQPSQSRTPFTQKIGDYYAACMDESSINAAGIKPLQAQLERIAGLQTNQDLALVAADLTDTDILFDLRSDQDYKDSTQEIAEVDQDGLGLPDRDFYLLQDPKSLKLRKAYAAHLRKMFELMGDDPHSASTESKSVLRIETALARGSMDRVDRRDPQKVYHKISVQQLQSLSPAFQWEKYFAKSGLPALQSLNVTTPVFFQAMNRQLDKEKLDRWKAYLRWHLVHSYAAYLSQPFVDAEFDFYGKTLQGAQTLEPRWKRCVNYVDDDLGEALGQAYVAQAFSPEARQRALTMVKQIENAMQRQIESSTWMTPETRQQALEKLHAVANKIGYPDKWRDYSAVAIASDDLVGNVRRAREFEFRRELAKIGKPVDHGEWSMTPPTVNAYYDAQMNDINFPAGILQPPLFDPESDDAPNYGDTGATIGHELTHGFDDEGRKFDARGNLRDWWTSEDAKQFEQRAACVSNQYSQYTVVDRIKINGKLTLGEDVADLGGVILAYMAWKEQTRGENPKPLQGFTPEQRFFIGYGQSWCSDAREETRRLRATADPHSPDEYRTNGVLSNLPQFQQAFHCKADAPMVRQNQCRVW